MWKKTRLTPLLVLMYTQLSYATPNTTELAVWANEAIIAIYSFDSRNYLKQQKEIAQYFSAEGWMAYSKALDASKLIEQVEKNAYTVSAVATLPPKITTIDPTHWQATMPILVLYENPQYRQKQNINVTLTFSSANPGQGIRGFSILSFVTKEISPPCACPNEQEKKLVQKTI